MWKKKKNIMGYTSFKELKTSDQNPVYYLCQSEFLIKLQQPVVCTCRSYLWLILEDSGQLQQIQWGDRGDFVDGIYHVAQWDLDSSLD